MEFSVCGKSISSAAVTPTNGVITYAIPQDVMIIPVAETVIGVQVIGHNGDTIIKSPIVKARISNSLQDSSTVASDSPVDVETRVEQLEAVKHTHSNKDTLDKLSDSNGKLQYNGSDISITKNGVINALGYTPEAVSKQVTAGSNIALSDNTEYRLTDVTTLTLTSYPTGNFECWMRLNFAASGDITVTLPAGTGYIGTAPDFKNGETWELSFKDKILAAQKVGEGT